MTERLEILFSLIDECDVFADIGCDHGYISQKILQSGRAKKVYASDISEPSLNKTIETIGGSFNGRFFAFVSDGFANLPTDVDEALIAGMGGEEICHILSSAAVLPQKLILQPMKNSEKVRRLLVGMGYGITRDFTFFSAEKYYDAIKADKSIMAVEYTPLEYAYGGENVRNRGEGFLKFVRMKIKELENALQNIRSEAERQRVQTTISRLKGFL